LWLGLIAQLAAAIGSVALGATRAEQGAGLIAYERRVAGGPVEIWLMNSDGTDQRRLTRGCCVDWSPDGRRIAFAGDDGTYVIRVDGSERTRLGERTLHRPDWSPDGARIAFTGEVGLFVVRADGGAPQKVASGSIDSPRWSPDSRRLAFERYLTENGRRGSDIFVVGTDASPLRRLTFDLGHSSPTWSADGRRLAYQGYEDQIGNYEIYVLAADGPGDVSRLTTTDHWEGPPAWSPRGPTIAFTGGRGVYTIRADARQYRRVARRASRPNWSSDARSIAFNRARDGSGRSDIWVMSASGKNQVNLTHSQGTIHNVAPVWSPVRS
jgi:Tol biopolymer transport system component